MIKDTISSIEKNIQESSSINDEKKKELLGLVDSLKNEVLNLSETHKEKAKSLANLAKETTQAAVQTDKNDSQFDHLMDSLSKSVMEFEASHPKLVGVVNSICTSLSNSGF